MAIGKKKLKEALASKNRMFDDKFVGKGPSVLLDINKVAPENKPYKLYPDALANPLPTIPPPNDAWAHRSMHMRCKTCMWYSPKGMNIGRCRRRAPTMNGYPVVFITDWCGDHKLNEETA